MVYLDYSATTPVDKKVLDNYVLFNKKHFANPNSTHELGKLVKKEIDNSTKEINDILGCENYEVIYTSGATEANNLALKGYALANSFKGKHIITSPYEHSSVISCLNYLNKQGFIIDVLDTFESGLIDTNELEELIREDTILVSIALVNSELGILQDFEAIKKVLKKHKNITFHSDLTQAIGKLKVDLTGIDLVTFSGHKIYGLKGIGALLRKRHIHLEPVIHGGASTSIFRGGTPPAPLINSLAVALKEAYKEFSEKRNHIEYINKYLRESLSQINNTNINYKFGIPQILNVSFLDIDASKLHKELSKREIYISTQTACNSESTFSLTVKRITKSDELAKTSIRISISHLTKKSEIDILIKAIKEIVYENN